MSQFKWNYIERVEGELAKLVDSRKAHESFIKGVNQAENDEVDLAIETLKEYTLEQSKDWLGYYLLGELQAYHKTPPDLKEAEKSFTKSKEAKGNLNVYLQFGVILMQRQDYSEAIIYLTAADELCYKITIVESDVFEEKNGYSENEIHSKLAEAIGLEFFELFDSGIDYQTKKPADIASIDILTNLSECYIMIEDYDSAMWFLRRSISLSKEPSQLEVQEVLLTEKINAHITPQKILKANVIALSLNEEEKEEIPLPLRNNLLCLVSISHHSGKCVGLCHYILSHKQQKLSCIEEALKVNSKSSIFELRHCKLLHTAGVVVQCEQKLRSFLTRYGQQKNKEAMMQLGFVLITLNRSEEALVFLEAGLIEKDKKLDESDLKEYLRVARVANEMEKHQNAIKILEKCGIEIQTHSNLIKHSFQIQLARAYLGLNLPRQALVEVKESLKLKKDNVNSNILMGQIFIELKRLPEAKQIFRKYLQQEEIKMKGACYWLGKIYLIEDPEDLSELAEQQFKKQIHYLPTHTKSKFELGKIYYQQGLYREALTQLNHTFKEDKVKEDHFELMSNVLWKMKHFQEFQDLLIVWQNWYPENSEDLSYRIGRVSLFQIRDIKISEQYYSIYLSIIEKQERISSSELELRRFNAMYNLAVISKLNKKIDNKQVIDKFDQIVNTNPKMWECYFQIATLYLELNNISESERYLEKGFTYNPTHAKGLLDAAHIQLFCKKNPKQSVKLVKKSLLICDTSDDAYLILGYAYRKLNKMEKSVSCLQNVQNYSKKVITTKRKCLYLGFTLFETKKYTEALNLLETIQFFEKQAKHSFYLAECLRLSGQFIDSKKKYEECAAFGKKKYYTSSIQNIFDLILYSERNHKNWISSLKNKLSEFSKDNPEYDGSEINKLIGIAYMEEGESFEKALVYFNLSLNKDPQNIECLVGKARCLYVLHRDNLDVVESFIEEIHRSIEQSKYKLSKNSSYHILLSKIKLRRKQENDALFHVETAFNGLESILEKKNLYQRLLYETQYQRAIVLMEIPLKKEEGIDILKSNLLHAPSNWRLGTLNPDRVLQEKQYHIANQIDMNFAPIILSLARMEKDKGRDILSIRYYETYLKRVEIKSNIVIIELAQCHIRNKNFKIADELASKVLLKDSNYFQAWQMKGIAQFGIQDYPKSLESFTKAIEIKEDSSQVLFHLSQCKDKIETNKQGAIELLEKAIKIEQNQTYYLELGKLYLIENLYDEGEQALNKCVQLNPSNEEALLKLGEFYLQKRENIVLAEQWISSCLKINPKNIDCLKYMVDIFIEMNNFSKIENFIIDHKSYLENQPLLILDLVEKCIPNSHLVQFSILKNLLQMVIEFEAKELKKLKEKAESEKKAVLKDNLTLNGARAQLYWAQISFYLKKYKEASTTNKRSSEKIKEMKIEDQIIFYYVRAHILLVTALPQNLKQVRMYFTKCIKLIQQNRKLSKQFISLIPTLKLIIASTFLEEQRYKKFICSVEEVKTSIISTIEELPNAIYALSLIIQADIALISCESLLLLKKAKKILKETLKHFPKSTICHLRLGEVYRKLLKKQKAQNSLLQCINYQWIPQDSLRQQPLRQIQIIQAHCTISSIYEELNNIEDAKGQIQIAMDEFPDRLEPLAKYAQILFSVGQYEQAYEKASRVAQIQRSNSLMHWIVGRCQMELNHPQNAVKPFKYCKHYDPDFPEIDINIAQAQELSSDNKEAIETYFKLFQKNWLDVEILHKCIKILTTLGKLDQAFTLFQKSQIILEEKGIPIPLDVQFAIALLEKRRGNISQSIDILRSIIAQDPLHHEASFTLCTSLFEQKQFSNTISVCQSYIKVIENQTEIPSTNYLARMHNLCGNVFAQTNDFSSSITSFLTAIDYEPSNSNIMTNAGTSYLAIKQPQIALNLFQKAHAADKSSVVPLLFIAISQTKLGQLSLAVKTYKKCLQLYSFFTPAVINLSILLRKLRNHSEAIKTLLPVVKSYPNFITPSYHLALAHFESGETTSAINLLQKLISSYNENIEYTRNMSADTLLTALPNYIPEESLEEFVISYQLSRLKVPRKADLILLLSRVHRQMNRIDNELKLLDLTIKNEREANPLYEFAHAISLSLSNKRNLSLSELYSCMNNDEQRTPLYLLAMANEQHQRGQLREELETLQKCVALSPLFVQAWDNLGSLYAKLGLRDYALDVFKKSIKLKPTNSNSHYNLGNAYLQLFQVDNAIQSYEKCIAIDKHHLKAHFNLGLAYSNAEKPDIPAAIRQFNTCLKLDPININIYLGKLHKLHKILVVQEE